MGTDQDVKLMSSVSGCIILNRCMVVSKASISLGEDVTHQLEEQMGGIGSDDAGGNSYRVREEVKIFR
jgi:hypothetical protein